MIVNSTKNLLGLLVAILVFVSCGNEPTLNNWTLNLPIIGTNSSPKCIDLNGDGIKDIVLGCGKNEFSYSEIGVLAVNGANGDTLWTAPATDQMYGSALFKDVNKDGTPDVIINGRALNLFCLDGKNGNLIWKYEKTADNYTPAGLARFNFYNPTFIKDINNDNLEDLLVLNSGNVDALPYDSLNRHPGVLLVLDSKTGKALQLDTMPDGKESYMAPVVYDFNDDGKQSLIFATGGETISGNIYSIDLDAYLANGLAEKSTLLTYKNQHGFIAPPMIADFNNDRHKDLVVANHGGFLSLLDGKSNLSKVWEIELPGVELNAQPTFGNFNNDEYLDIFISGALGQWPKNTGSKQFFIDGRNGEIIKSYEIGCSGFSSPLTMNVDEDPEDEALMYINEFDCRRYNTMFNLSAMYIFGVDTISQFAQTSGFGKNISSTPWMGDLDNDGQLDLISLIAENTRVFHEFMGFKVIRNEYNYNLNENLKWGSYMGDQNKCVYEN